VDHNPIVKAAGSKAREALHCWLILLGWCRLTIVFKLQESMNVVRINSLGQTSFKVNVAPNKQNTNI
jgi:hypothetical protein